MLGVVLELVHWNLKEGGNTPKSYRLVQMQMNEQTYLWELYQKLLAFYGPQGWWPSDDSFEVCLGAILTQNTSWKNVEKALANLKRAEVCSINHILALTDSDLGRLIYPSRYFNSKSKTLKEFARCVLEKFKGELDQFLELPVEDLRHELLGIWGIGNETADDIILYAAKKPTFVIDAYTRRVGLRLGLSMAGAAYGSYRKFFVEYLPNDSSVLNELHALVVRLGKDLCLKQNPRCGGCPLLSLCVTGLAVTEKL